MAAADVVPPNVVAVEVFVVHVVADLLFGWLSNDLQNQANYFGCYVLAQEDRNFHCLEIEKFVTWVAVTFADMKAYFGLENKK